MKKILLSALALTTGFGAFAQNFVSTTPANKNVVLEELTGKTCGYCPDGHRIGGLIKDNNPGRVVLLNIHTGSYASGTPNYTSSWGDYVGGLFPVSGYPTGAVNRTVMPNSPNNPSVYTSRGAWTTNSATVLGESSPVNVAAEATINTTTRELTVDVEAYYTAAGPGSTNNLHVVILQNNIAGPQSGASANPTAILPNGDYNHTHMVRHNLSPNAGETISTISATNLYTKSYTYTLPADYNSIPVNVLGDMEVAVYVSESGSTGKIITGAYASMDYILPGNQVQLDGAASTSHTLPADMCTQSFTPEVTYTNNSTSETADTIEVSYTLNGGTPVSTELYPAGGVAPGASYTHTFPAITLVAGNNTISYSVSNGTSVDALDFNNTNNTTATFDLPYIPSTSIGSSYNWDFESSANGVETWDNTINTANSDFFVISQSMFNGIPNALGGHAGSTKSFRHRLYSMNSGDNNDFITYKFDLSSVANPSFEFEYAYAQFTAGSNDGIKVNVSTDCGANWTEVFNKSGDSFTTAPATGGTAAFYPTASQWKIEKIDLSAYKQADVMIKLSVVAGSTGNCLYLDNINVHESTVGIDDVETQIGLNISPNPTNDISTMTFNLNESTTVGTEIINSLGSVVFNNVETMNAGTQRVIFDGTDLPNGIYFVNLTIGEEVITKKVSLIK